MTKIKKLIFSIMFLGLIISLSSCDFHFEKLFSSDDTKETTDNKEKEESNTGNETTDNKEKEPENTGTGTEGNEGNTTDDNTSKPIGDKINEIIGNIENEIIVDNPTDNEKTNEEELKIKDYILDYNNYYEYQKLGEIPVVGEDLQTIYSQAFEEAKVVLTSADDYTTTSFNMREGDVTVSRNYYVLDPIKINDDKIKSGSFTIEMAVSAIMEMIYDNPLFYFLTPGYLKSTDSVYLTLIDEYATAEARTIMNNNILAMISDFKTNNNYESMSNYKKIETINKYISNKISYAKDSSNNPEDAYWAHNLEGFVNSTYNKGVCECYAKACSLLTNVVGIDSLLVTGLASSGGSTGGHAWNYVKLDDKWYGLDVTWNDSDSIMQIGNGNYFLVGSNKMSQDHTPYGQTYGTSFRIEFPTLETHSYSIL